MSLEYHFEDIVQLKPKLNIFHGEKHVHFGYIRVLKKIWAEQNVLLSYLINFYTQS